MAEPSDARAALKTGLARQRRSLALLIVATFLLHIFLLIIVTVALPADALPLWLAGLIVGALPLTTLAVLALWRVDSFASRAQVAAARAAQREMADLRLVARRSEALQEMATTMSATLSHARVMELALEASAKGIASQVLAGHEFVGAVFLYEGDLLVPVANYRLPGRDVERPLHEAGLVAEAIEAVEPAISDAPARDPELGQFVAFQECKVAVCLPLRAAFRIFGVMVLGSQADIVLDAGSLDFLRVLGDQAVIALQNAQLHQELVYEKQRLIEADEEARKELARALHDGPTQSISAIAMQASFIQSLLGSNPRMAYDELGKVEKLARTTAQEVRGMLFTLRPLVLEAEGLAAAVQAVLDRLTEQYNVRARLVGGEFGDLLAEHAQGVVFSIVEEAVGNARKHARASAIEVRFWREGGLFVARVQDDGRGFDVEEVMENYSGRGSLGMVNIRERAERVEGSVKMDSQPGRGTAVTLVVPLNANNRAPAESK